MEDVEEGKAWVHSWLSATHIPPFWKHLLALVLGNVSLLHPNPAVLAGAAIQSPPLPTHWFRSQKSLSPTFCKLELREEG